MANAKASEYSSPWITTLVKHEGALIALRVRPNANTPTNRKRYSRRLAIVHELEKVMPNGLPEQSYNESLAGFDQEIHQTLQESDEGLVVLVETFSGRRVYFIYADAIMDIETRLNAVKLKYPQHRF